MRSKINSIKGYNQTQTKTLNFNNKTITDKKKITVTFGSFFQANSSNRNYEKGFIALKTTTKTNSSIKYDVDSSDNSINSFITVNELTSSLKKKE